MNRIIPPILCLALIAFVAAVAVAEEHPEHSMAGHDEAAMKQPEMRVGDPWPLGNCPVSGEELSDKPVVRLHEGREIRFCCKKCAAKFEADPEKFLTKADAAIADAQRPYYPLTNCVVSGEKLSENKDENVEAVIGNRLFVLCCPKCAKKVLDNQQKYIETLDKAAAEQQRAEYPMTKCVVSGEELGGEMGKPIEYVLNGRLVRLCCKDCAKELEKNPAKYLGMLDAAADGMKMEGHHEMHDAHMEMDDHM